MDDRKRANIITEIAKLKRQMSEVAAATGGGVSGVPGACGVSGVSGVPGACGVSGVSGVPGACGVSGVAGAAGACGVSGTAGAAGACGVSGVAGAAGACGVSGVAGACGVSGVPGACGVSGVAGACGVSGISGIPGTIGGDSFAFTYDNSATTDSDPGNGKFKFNNATIASVTKIFIDLLDSGGTDVTAWLDSLDDTANPTSATLKLLSRSDPTKWVIFSLTTVTTATGYRKLNVVYVSSNGTLPTTAADIILTASLSGNPGACGISGVAGACGVSGVAGACGVSGVGVDGTAWSTWTPTVTSSAGAITTVGAVSGRYKQIGKIVEWRCTIAITTAGAGNGGSLQWTLPVTAKDATAVIGHGREMAIIGKGMALWLNSTTQGISNYDDNTGPVASGASYQLGGTYEAA